MNTNIQRFFLLTLGLLFCVLGCTRDRAHLLMPDPISEPIDVHVSADVVKASFEQNVLPLLAAKCAFSGCHGENPQEGYDYRTYTSFIAGGEHGPVFIPGNAEESEIVKEVVEGKMPPPDSGRPTLSEAELQVLIDWINQQELQDDIALHDDHHDEEEDAHVGIDDEHDEEEDAHVGMDDHHDEDMDDEHDDMDDEHDDDIHDEHDDMNNGHAEDNDDNHDNGEDN